MENINTDRLQLGTFRINLLQCLNRGVAFSQLLSNFNKRDKTQVLKKTVCTYGSEPPKIFKTLCLI